MRWMNRLALASLVVVATLGPLSAARAQSVEDVYPVEPGDGAVTGARPVFRIGVRGSEIVKMRFRVVLSRDDFETAAYTFDQVEDKNGWAFTSLDKEPGAVYYVRKPLAGGEYQWKVAAWNGLSWVEGTQAAKLIVDDVPPAAVDGLQMNIDRKEGKVILDWSPVATDRDGRPERVAKYHIYRYQRKSFFFVVTPFEIGTATQTHYEDSDPAIRSTALVFYIVTAEDEAGNKFEGRY